MGSKLSRRKQQQGEEPYGYPSGRPEPQPGRAVPGVRGPSAGFSEDRAPAPRGRRGDAARLQAEHKHGIFGSGQRAGLEPDIPGRFSGVDA